MLEADERTRRGRYQVLPSPIDPRTARLLGAQDASPFFFAWGDREEIGAGASTVVGDFSVVSGRRRAFGFASSAHRWARAAIAEADLEADDDSTLSVCRTSLYDRTKRESDPGRFIDTTITPYVTLGTRKAFRGTGVRLGDLVTVVHPSSGVYCHAIVGDSREVAGVEPSLSLAETIGLIPGEALIYLVHPESGAGQGAIPSCDQIALMGESLFRQSPEQGPPGWDWEQILADYFATPRHADKILVECGRDAGTRALRAWGCSLP